MGDFNYPGIDWENMSTSGGRDAESFYEKMNDYLFIQHVKFNTRHRINNVSSRLDLIFTNEEEMIGNISPEVPLGRTLTKNRITFGPISILFCKKRLLKAKK